jgi:hypothetical protein
MKDGIVMSEMHMENFCRIHKFIRWFETSARENRNIRETFSFLIDEVRKKMKILFLKIFILLFIGHEQYNRCKKKILFSNNSC